MALSHEDTAGFYWCALHQDLIPPRLPVQWADRLIAQSDSPDLTIIELSLAAGKPIDAVMDVLKPMFSRPTIAALQLCGALLNALVTRAIMSEASAANQLYSLRRVDENTIEALGEEIFVIDEWFEEWMYGPTRAHVEVRAFLRRFDQIELPDDVRAWLDSGRN
jgi:hypothetical protein